MAKLTRKDWEKIEARLLSGENRSKIARDFRITEGAIRSKLSTKLKQAKTVANQVVAAEVAFNSLPIATKITTQSIIDELRAVSTHLAGAAKYGAMTAHRLSGIANQQIDKIDDVDPMGDKSMEALKGIAALTEVANKAAQTGINLLNANKDLIAEQNEQARRYVPQDKSISSEESYKLMVGNVRS